MALLKNIINKFYLNSSNPSALLSLIAMLIAIRVMFITHGWVNTDSLLYFEQARLISNFDFSAAYELFKWPLYPSILGLTHYITHLDIQLVAQIWNTLFFGVFCLGFFKLILHLGGNRITLLLSALLIFSNQYIVGDILPMLLRDEGFWAAFIWGLLFFIRYYQTQQIKEAYLFQICFIIATLFRIEAIVYLFTLPTLLLITTNTEGTSRLKLYLNATTIALVIGACIALAFLLGLIDYNHIGRLQELNFNGERSNSIFQAIHEKAEIFGNEVLGSYLDNYALQSLLISYFWIVVIKTLKVTSIPVVLILALGRQGIKSIDAKATHVFVIVILTGLIIAYTTILQISLLSSRYVIAIAIVLLVLSTFAFQHLLSKLSNKWLRYSLISILGLMLIANLYDNQHIDLDRETVNYITSLNVDHSTVFYDTENARYYAHRPYENRILETELVNTKINNGEIFNYQYIVITVDNGQSEYESSVKSKLAQYDEIKTIYGWKKKSKAIIFKKNE
jgi:hypothetical protein